MEMRWLTAFVAVADEGTFAGAAEALGYTQSTVSQQIAALERGVKGAVFDRSGGARRSELTPLGRVVLDRARRLVAGSAALMAAVAQFNAGVGRVEIGTFQTVTSALLPPVILQLLAESPACEVRLFEEELTEPTVGGRDLVFFDAPPPPGAQGELVVRDNYVLLAPAGRFPVGLVRDSALHELDVVALPALCDQARVEALLRSRGIAPRVVFRTADNAAVVSMVRTGLGCAVLPWLAVESTDGVEVHDLQPGLPSRAIYAHWTGELSPVARRVLELVARRARELASDRVHTPPNPLLVE